MNRLIYLFLAVLSVLINTGSCIKCYNCISSNNKDCLDPYSKLQPQECSVNLVNDLSKQAEKFATSIGTALKIDIDANTQSQLTPAMACQKVESVVNGEKFIVRSCQINDIGEMKTCESLERKSKDLTHCTLCHEDGCNAGHWMTPFSTIILLIPAILLSTWSIHV